MNVLIASVAPEIASLLAARDDTGGR